MDDPLSLRVFQNMGLYGKFAQSPKDDDMDMGQQVEKCRQAWQKIWRGMPGERHAWILEYVRLYRQIGDQWPEGWESWSVQHSKWVNAQNLD